MSHAQRINWLGTKSQFTEKKAKQTTEITREVSLYKILSMIQVSKLGAPEAVNV